MRLVRCRVEVQDVDAIFSIDVIFEFDDSNNSLRCGSAARYMSKRVRRSDIEPVRSIRASCDSSRFLYYSRILTMSYVNLAALVRRARYVSKATWHDLQQSKNDKVAFLQAPCTGNETPLHSGCFELH